MVNTIQIGKHSFLLHMIEGDAKTEDGKLAKLIEHIKKMSGKTNLFKEEDYEKVEKSQTPEPQDYSDLKWEYMQFSASNTSSRETSQGFAEKFEAFLLKELEGDCDYSRLRECFRYIVDIYHSNLDLDRIEDLFNRTANKLKERDKTTQASYLLAEAYAQLHGKLANSVEQAKDSYEQEIKEELGLDDEKSSAAMSSYISLSSQKIIGQDLGIKLQFESWVKSDKVAPHLREFIQLLLDSPEKLDKYCEKIKELDEYVSAMLKDTDELLEKTSKRSVELYREGYGQSIPNARLVLSGMVAAGKAVHKKDIGVQNYAASELNMIIRNKVTGDAEVIVIDKTISKNLIKTRLDNFIAVNEKAGQPLQNLEINLVGCSLGYNLNNPNVEQAKANLRKVLSVCITDSKSPEKMPGIANIELFKIDTPTAFVFSVAPGEFTIKKGLAAEKPDYYKYHFAIIASEGEAEKISNLAFSETKAPYNPYYIGAEAKFDLKCRIVASRYDLANIEHSNSKGNPVELVCQIDAVREFALAYKKFMHRSFYVMTDDGAAGSILNGVVTALSRGYLRRDFNQSQLAGLYAAAEIPTGFFVGAGSNELNDKYTKGFTSFDTKTRATEFLKITDKGAKITLDASAVKRVANSLLGHAKSQRADNVGFAGKVKSENSHGKARG